MSTTASGAPDLPDTKLGGDVKHLGETALQQKVCVLSYVPSPSLNAVRAFVLTRLLRVYVPL
jgi:hypothetical protein